MFLGHDLNWWSFILAVTALISTVPLTVFGNLITPRLKDWWSTRSTSSLKRRIAKLQDELEGYERDYNLVDETEAFILRGISVLGNICILIVELIGLTYWVVDLTFDHADSGKMGGAAMLIRLIILIGPIFLLSYLLKKRYFAKLDKYRIPRSPHVRTDLASTIAKLQEKLSVLNS